MDEAGTTTTIRLRTSIAGLKRATGTRHGLRADRAILRDLAAGACAGTVGTIAMSTLMLSAQRAGWLGEQPPRRLSDVILDTMTGGRADERTRRVGTALIHLGIGATAAAVHQAGRRAAGRPGPAAIWGGGFGAVFWAVNYGLLAPAVGLMPPPDRDRPGRAPVMLAANVIWGAVSAAAGDRLARMLEPHAHVDGTQRR